MAARPAQCADGHCVGCGHCVSKRPDSRARLIVGGAPRRARSSAAPGIGEVPEDLAKLIDHTLLRADATYADIDKLCDEAAQVRLRVGVREPDARPALRRSGSAARSSVVCTVVGFPLGATPSENKALEARRAIRDGAREIDMVHRHRRAQVGRPPLRRRGHPHRWPRPRTTAARSSR